jgi:hypothetical protein
LKVEQPGQRSDGFVISGMGTFISHPDPAYQYPRENHSPRERSSRCDLYRADPAHPAEPKDRNWNCH